MPWWSWILIWTALVAVSALFYVLLGIRLFRKFTATMRELGQAGDRFGRRSPAPAATGSGDAGRQTQPVPGSAVFVPASQMRHEYTASKAARRELRRQRRVQRKADRGQPQALRDIDFG
jgi:hypothetical protein